MRQKRSYFSHSDADSSCVQFKSCKTKPRSYDFRLKVVKRKTNYPSGTDGFFGNPAVNCSSQHIFWILDVWSKTPTQLSLLSQLCSECEQLLCKKNRKLRPFSPSKLEDKMCHVLYQRGRSFPVKGLSSVSLISVSFLAYHSQTYWKLWIPRNDLNLQNFGSVTCPTGKSAFLCDFLIQDIKHDKNSTTANILKNSKISPPVHVNKKNP